MSDTYTEPSANGMAQTIAELERRVIALEAKVAAIPDTKQIEERITSNVKASLPPPPPPVDPTMPPSFKDIEIPMPSVQTVVDTAKVTWGFIEMLRELPFVCDALPAIRGHHERIDGRGYPDKLGGDGIHLHARIMAVADSFDAMTSARPYRNALPLDEAARRVRADAGTQFDATVVQAFDRAEAELRAMINT